MNFIEKLFSEAPGVSCMRVLAVTSLTAGIIISFVSLYKNIKIDSNTVAIFVGAAFGGKVLQKSKETLKNESKK